MDHFSTTTDIESLPQAVVAHVRDLTKGDAILPHSHRRDQLVYASEGVMTVSTELGTFVVPPERAVWMPGGTEHRIDAKGDLAMRTLYIEPNVTTGLPKEVCVLQITPLLRCLILEAVDAPQIYQPGSAEERLMQVVLDQIVALPTAPLNLPIPKDRRLRKITDKLMENPADCRDLQQWATEAGASARTLARLFQAETKMPFRSWRQQLRLMRALEMLAADVQVTTVALDLGYESVSAFTAMFRRAFGVPPTRYFNNQFGSHAKYKARN
ncbi:MAG: helix-turn-helix transcriptional regulator [Proteobacteria bacterium]|nr:helix-turn-helix transcriptional regulator [Pseudomonadota bacterium]